MFASRFALPFPKRMNHTHRFCCALLAAIPASLAGAQPLGSPVPPTVGNPNRFAVTGVPAAARFWHLAATKRVDMAIIGDSNTRQLTYTGHEDGMGRAFAAKFGMYATRLDPFAGQGSYGAQTMATSSTQIGPFQISGAPTNSEQYTFVGDGLPNSYGFLAAGVDCGWTYNTGLTITHDNPLSIESHLRYHLADYPLAGGTYVLTARAPYPGNPFVDFAFTQVTPAPTPGIRNIEFDIPAGTRDDNGILIAPSDLQNVRGSIGPLLPLYHRVENVDRTTGISYSPMWFQGGMSARKVLQDFYQSPRNITAMREWMSQVTRTQGGTPADSVLLVHIMHGGNDVVDQQPSLGPSPGFPSHYPEGQQDNTRGIINWVRAAWVASGRDPDNLFFCLGPYHPQTNSLTSLQGYEQGWRTIAAGDPQVFTVAGSMLSTPAEFTANGLYRFAGFDTAHLAYFAYGLWGNTLVHTISRAVCPGDFDENGTLAVADIFAMINDWFAGNISADANYSGGLEVQDVFDFLTLWFAGC